MLKNLLLKPRAAVPQLVGREPKRWLAPLAGFFFVSFSGGYERAVTRSADLSGIALIGIVAMGALLIGVWSWAGIVGGALYLSARALKGKPGLLDSVMAVGYGFFWPGVLAFISAVAVILGGYRGLEISTVSSIGVLLQVGAGVWAWYTVAAAIKAHHEFSWWKTIAACLLPFGVLILAVLVYVTITK